MAYIAPIYPEETVFRAETTENIQTFGISIRFPNGADFCGDHSQFLCYGVSSYFIVLDYARNKVHTLWKSADLGLVSAVATHPDRNLVAFAGSERRPFVCVLDVRGDRAMCILMRSDEEDQSVTITSLSWKNDILLMIEGNSKNGKAFIIDTMKQTVVGNVRLENDSGPCFGGIFIPNGSDVVAFATVETKEVKIWEMDRRGEIHLRSRHSKQFSLVGGFRQIFAAPSIRLSVVRLKNGRLVLMDGSGQIAGKIDPFEGIQASSHHSYSSLEDSDSKSMGMGNVCAAICSLSHIFVGTDLGNLLIFELSTLKLQKIIAYPTDFPLLRGKFPSKSPIVRITVCNKKNRICVTYRTGAIVMDGIGGRVVGSMATLGSGIEKVVYSRGNIVGFAPESGGLLCMMPQPEESSFRPVSLHPTYIHDMSSVGITYPRNMHLLHAVGIGSSVCVTDKSGTLSILQLSKGDSLSISSKIRTMGNLVSSVSVSHNGRYIACTDLMGILFVYDMMKSSELVWQHRFDSSSSGGDSVSVLFVDDDLLLAITEDGVFPVHISSSRMRLEAPFQAEIHGAPLLHPSKSHLLFISSSPSSPHQEELCVLNVSTMDLCGRSPLLAGSMLLDIDPMGLYTMVASVDGIESEILTRTLFFEVGTGKFAGDMRGYREITSGCFCGNASRFCVSDAQGVMIVSSSPRHMQETSMKIGMSGTSLRRFWAAHPIRYGVDSPTTRGMRTKSRSPHGRKRETIVDEFSTLQNQVESIRPRFDLESDQLHLDESTHSLQRDTVVSDSSYETPTKEREKKEMDTFLRSHGKEANETDQLVRDQEVDVHPEGSMKRSIGVGTPSSSSRSRLTSADKFKRLKIDSLEDDEEYDEMPTSSKEEEEDVPQMRMVVSPMRKRLESSVRSIRDHDRVQTLRQIDEFEKRLQQRLGGSDEEGIHRDNPMKGKPREVLQLEEMCHGIVQDIVSSSLDSIPTESAEIQDEQWIVDQDKESRKEDDKQDEPSSS